MNIIHGIPSGGGANYVLSKNSATDFDVSWKQPIYLNRNILINSDFRFPVNQIGKTSFDFSSDDLLIDCWYRYGGLQGTLTSEIGGVHLSTTTTWVGIQTYVEGLYLSIGNYTFSCLVKNIGTTSSNCHFILLAFRYDGTYNFLINPFKNFSLSPGEEFLYVDNFSVAENFKYVDIVLGSGDHSTQEDLLFEACKLEAGNFSTLCYPGTNEIIESVTNYNEQLAKCKRYLIVYPADSFYKITLGGGNDYDIQDNDFMWAYRQPTIIANLTNMADFYIKDTVVSVSPSSLSFLGRNYILINLPNKIPGTVLGDSGFCYLKKQIVFNMSIVS